MREVLVFIGMFSLAWLGEVPAFASQTADQGVATAAVLAGRAACRSAPAAASASEWPVAQVASNRLATVVIIPVETRADGKPIRYVVFSPPAAASISPLAARTLDQVAAAQKSAPPNRLRLLATIAPDDATDGPLMVTGAFLRAIFNYLTAHGVSAAQIDLPPAIEGAAKEHRVSGLRLPDCGA